MNTPEALRLAKMLESYNSGVMSQRIVEDYQSAANELCRLHAENERLRTELAASQAREKVRIEALTHCSTDEGPEQEWLNQAREVLALPADDTALRAALDQRERETIKRCIAACKQNLRSEDANDRTCSDGNFNIGVEECVDSISALEVKP